MKGLPEEIVLCGVTLRRDESGHYVGEPLSVRVDPYGDTFQLGVFGIGQPFGVRGPYLNAALERAERRLRERLRNLQVMMAWSSADDLSNTEAPFPEKPHESA